MRLIKVFGLAGVTAVVAMAFLGVASASAKTTLLCSSGGVLQGSDCTVITKIHYFTVGHAVLLGTINVECNGLLSATTDDPLGSSVVFDKEVLLHYTGCLGGCKMTVVQQGKVSFLKTGIELADVRGSEFIISVTCFGLNCDYDWSNLAGHAVRSEGKSHITYDKDSINVLEKLGGFISCPAAGALDALYRSLSDVFVRA